MMASDLKLIAGALEHYANDNPGNSPKEEIERVIKLAMYFWAEAEAEERVTALREEAAAERKKRGH